MLIFAQSVLRCATGVTNFFYLSLHFIIFIIFLWQIISNL